MDSITLKSELGKVVTLMGFNRLNEYMIEWEKIRANNHIWSGAKEYISLKDESFWKELVEKEGIPYVDYFKDYKNDTWIRFAKESGLSAIESLSENLYILIVETKE
jgi:hypothetical protein